jgi:hypothetical protein
MALITCPECSKEVSDKANACPSCGFPVTLKEELICPDFPNDLNIGKQIVNWGGDASFIGNFKSDENTINIPNGIINLMLHTHGINITSGFLKPLYQIHNSQIISIKQTTQSELVAMNKSVAGRAVVGAIILGPLGALLGGMTALGNNVKSKDKSFLVINFWDTDSKTPQTILISGEKPKIELFIKRNKKEDKINQTTNRIADNSKKGCLGALIFVIAIGFLLLNL